MARSRRHKVSITVLLPWGGPGLVDTGVRGAVSVLGEPCKIGTFDRLSRPTTLNRGRVDYPYVIRPETGIGGKVRNHGLHGAREAAEALVIAGLLRNVWEQVSETGASVSDPTAFVVVLQESLHDGEGNQFRVTDPWDQSDFGSPWGKMRVRFQIVVTGDVECYSEGVQVVVHSGSYGSSLRVQPRTWTPSTPT